MLNNIDIVNPNEIEKRSFEIISSLMEGKVYDPLHDHIIKRVVHTTADFEYVDILKVSNGALDKGTEAIRAGSNIVTDTRMAAAGINKKVLETFGGQVQCFIDDEQIAREAKKKNITRSALCMDEAITNENNKIFVIGNAPTALIRLYELIEEKKVQPALVIGVPVGFVNVVKSKELLKTTGIPYIISEGRKGGSNVAAAIVNAILYKLLKDE